MACAQNELNYLFNSIVLLKIMYTLPAVGASPPDLHTLQCFLDRCFKRRYTSVHYNIFNLLEQQDTRIFHKISNNPNHPLRSLLPI